MPETNQNPPNQTPPNNQPPANPPPAQPDERQKEIDRLLAENANLRKANNETSTKLSTLEQTVKQLQTAGHKTAGDWQKVAETAEKERDEWRGKFENVNKAYVETKKFEAVKEQASKLGLLPEAMNDIEALEFQEVAVAIDSHGRFMVSGADHAANNLKKIRPHWFRAATPPAFNPGGGGNPPPAANGTPDLAKAKAEYQAALRTGDQKKIQPALATYNSALQESRKVKAKV